jgi:hypothetical protein
LACALPGGAPAAGNFALVLLALLIAVVGCADAIAAHPYGLHAMVYSNAPYAFKHKMFHEVLALGARDIRADLALTQVVTSSTGRDWRPVDQYVALARRHRLRVTLVLVCTPWFATAAPYSGTATYPARDPGQWGGWAGEIAARTRGTIEHFEIINEPDHAGFYLGTPQQYANTLIEAYRAIKAANPRATVLLGGLCRPIADGWIGAVLATPGAAGSFDVANVHLRGGVRSLARRVRAWKSLFASRPLWVTEHGYPSATPFQTDPRYRGGKPAQARYLRASLPALVRAGAAKVFVTLRDNLSGPYASESVLGGIVCDPPSADPQVVRKPSFYALRTLIRALARVSAVRR